MIKVNELKVLEYIEYKEYEELKKYIEDEVKMQTKISKNDKSKIKAIARFSKKLVKNERPNLKGAYTVENKTMLTDGYRGLILDCSLDDLPGIHKKNNDTEDFDLTKIADRPKDYKEFALDVEDMLLQYKKYKATKKEDKNKKSNLFKINEDLYVDIVYLKEMHDMLDLNECKMYHGDRVSPIYLENEKFFDTVAILLPIRVEN